MTPTPIPPGTALRLLLLAWVLDDPRVPAELHAWLPARLVEPGFSLTPAAYALLAPRFLAWGLRYNLAATIIRAREDAYHGSPGE